MIYLTSDLHIGHKNIIKHCNRPFETVEEMNETLIKKINKAVAPNHELWILGDYSFMDYKDTEFFTKQIKCQNKFLVRGNHDRLTNIEYLKCGFKGVYDYREIKWNKRKYCLSHFPFLTWNKAHRGSVMLHGHSHGTLNHLNVGVPRLDVGVDNFDYAPICITEIEEMFKKLDYTPVDHHK